VAHVGHAPTGTVTFLFTDIEGSTRLWDSAPEAMQIALERHDVLMRSVLASHGGYVFSTGGDGYAVAFARAGDALAAAFEVRDALRAEPWPEGAAIRVRIGLHSGEASERDGDYFGTSVNRAARLMAVAHGGQVVCSQTTASLIESEVPLRSLGEHRLRDLAAAEQVYQLGDDAFPPLRSVDAVPTNLPTVRTELIGRTDDVTTLMQLVERERLVTLTGVGGVGKTRLALGVAAAVAAGFADGCWLVELSPVANGEEVVKTIAAATRAPTTTTDALVEYLSDRRVLIVLDNCEHVLDAVADLVDAVLVDAADVHFVVTSREPLGLDGEQVRRVQSLAVPEAAALPREAEAAAAVRLFTERAAAVREGFAVDADNVAAVVEICRHLDGIPLAIELAAARVRAMAPGEIARRLDERFRLLAGGSRRSQERHRTLLATVSWSHDLLTDDERVVFRRLAVFPASFDLTAAEAVAGPGEADVVDCVLRLVDRSLVVYEPAEDRYRLLETLRQYGADRLAEAGEAETTRARHARHFLAFAGTVAPLLRDARFTIAETAVVAEIDNLRAAVDWLVETERWVDLADMCRDLEEFLWQTVPVDGADWYQHLVDHASALDEQVAIDVLGEAAWINVINIADFAKSVAFAERSLALAGAANRAAAPWAWTALSQVATFAGENHEALRCAEMALAAAEARGDERGAVVALCMHTTPLFALGEVERGGVEGSEAMRRAKGTGHPIYLTNAVVSAAAGRLWGSADPDLEACFDLLLAQRDDLTVGDNNGMWLDLAWGATLLGLHRPGAVGYLVRAARAADRLNAPHAFDFALRHLAVAAAEAELTSSAAALIAFTETNLRLHRMGTPGQTRLQTRLDRTLPDPADPPTASTLHRGEVMVIVTEIESALGDVIAAAITSRDAASG
jgi:predicted ATPase/class 3 adenylate cyclase